MAVWCVLAEAGLGMAATDTVPAEKTSGEASASDDHASRWSYTLGAKVQSRDVADASTDLSMRPVLGLRYGRWRFGHPTGTEWLRFSGYRKESNLAYQWRDDERLKVGLSLRVQNLQDNRTFDGFSSGQNTARGRVSVNYRLDPRWSLGSDLTQDLMNRGDGTTLSVGASYGLPLNDRSAISWNVLRNSSRYPGATAAIKHYLTAQMRSSFLEIPEDQWLAASQMPVERFVGANKETVFRDTRRLSK
jgi:hypothetical protein